MCWKQVLLPLPYHWPLFSSDSLLLDRWKGQPFLPPWLNIAIPFKLPGTLPPHPTPTPVPYGSSLTIPCPVRDTQAARSPTLYGVLTLNGMQTSLFQHNEHWWPSCHSNAIPVQEPCRLTLPFPEQTSLRGPQAPCFSLPSPGTEGCPHLAKGPQLQLPLLCLPQTVSKPGLATLQQLQALPQSILFPLQSLHHLQLA